MFIYTVKPGDSISSIANQFGVSTRRIIRLNELGQRDRLTPGLHLLLPARDRYMAQPYQVRAGDTLAQIARRVGVSEQLLRAWLGQRDVEALQAGTTLYVPKPVPQKRTMEVNAYLLPEGSASDANVVREIQNLTYLSVFSYQAQADGSLQPQRDEQALRAARQLGIQPLMTMTNFDGNTFNTELAHTILSNASLRGRLLNNAIETARRKGFSGLNIDFEHLRPGDRQLYNQFVREAAAALRRQRMSISIALGPKTQDMPTASWMGAFDYRALGEAVDFLMLMTYEWGWVGGPPMAVAPIDQVQAVLDYATSQMDSRKVLMGIALYGYDWTLPWRPGERASGLSCEAAMELAIERESEVLWDTRAASPYFHYTDGERRQHVVWFEDALSVAAKFNLVELYNLRGLSYWVLPNSFAQNWYLLDDVFDVRRGQPVPTPQPGASAQGRRRRRP
ncbi:glycosyl hydrolase family 18 protein [Alicyclobacillus shizuokensis]|uniref:glycosyl hydrolase family 18 protein n=1 Tax=Alicyclobacillus shizuokensis TaxID=392014 RepID=UPI00082CC62A|nr:glycosyl hydrolase family 18 protein [Alicyclobacillus shizuokensis]MCL6626711.1 LysM peptidoglycan-binding domain-containing protein [Alicyclobacillus shizuokensis]